MLNAFDQLMTPSTAWMFAYPLGVLCGWLITTVFLRR